MSQFCAARRGGLVVVILACVGASISPAGDWTTGAGGNSARNCLSDEMGPSAPELLWSGSRSAIVAQQAVTEGNLLVVSRIANFTIPSGTWIVAHELTSGEELWAVQLPYDFPGSSWRSRVSAIRDGQVYATRSGNTNSDPLYALDAADGSIIWRSEALIDEGSTESLAFADNGDLIAGGFRRLVRIDMIEGSPCGAWRAPVRPPAAVRRPCSANASTSLKRAGRGR